MKTIRTNYDNTISMNEDRWKEFKKSGKPMQVLNSQQKVIGYLLPTQEATQSISNNGYPIMVAEFLKWESKDDREARLQRIAKYCG